MPVILAPQAAQTPPPDYASSVRPMASFNTPSLHNRYQQLICLVRHVPQAQQTPPPDYAFSVRRVAVVGAGVAGLQTARALQKQGLAFVVFEEYEDVGGVWRANYADYKLQGGLSQQYYLQYHHVNSAVPVRLRRMRMLAACGARIMPTTSYRVSAPSSAATITVANETIRAEPLPLGSWRHIYSMVRQLEQRLCKGWKVVLVLRAALNIHTEQTLTNICQPGRFCVVCGCLGGSPPVSAARDGSQADGLCRCVRAVPWNVYEFPEFRYDKAKYKLGFLEQPTGTLVQEYIRDYTTHFGLRPHIRFNAWVQQLNAPAGAVWF